MLTLVAGVLIAAFKVFVSKQSSISLMGGERDYVISKSAGDSEIQRRWRPGAEPGDIDVSGPAGLRTVLTRRGLAVLAAAADERALRQEPRPFELRVEAGF